MKRLGRTWIVASAGVAAAAAAAALLRYAGAATATPAAGPGFAVVELFTSEGCSSCPPADVELSKLVAAARASGARVYPLAFHVDYWNRGGWADRFSDAAYSARQRAYRAALRLDQVYTPQAVVNGTTEFVGSQADRLSAAVAAGLAATPAATVRVTPTVDGQTVHAAVDVTAGAGDVVNVAIVERGLSSDVSGGENGGRHLRHDDVVRGFATADVASGGHQTVDVPLPVGAVRAKVSVIAYVQDGRTMRVLGAAGADLPVR